MLASNPEDGPPEADVDEGQCKEQLTAEAIVDANNGVLFGKGEVEALQRDEQLSIEDYFGNTPGFTGAPDTAAVYRSAFVEETNSSGSEKVYRTGDDAIVLQGGNESVVKILFLFAYC